MSADRKLHAVAPLERRRGVALIRVSKEREGMVSPENQRYSIEQYAERAGVEIIEWIEGIDESGSRRKSAWWPRLDQAIERVEAGHASVLLVWRIDRTARNRYRWAVATDRIETAGGYIESATEPNDRSPAGRFARGLMAEHAAFMAESIGATWKEQLERRVRHGLTPNGQRHFGYTYDRDAGTYSIDPVQGPQLAQMFRDYIAGVSAWEIADRLNGDVAPRADGTPYPANVRWSTPSVLRLLDSGFGAAQILFRGQLYPGAHEPVISADEWTLYQHVRDSRRRRPRAERSPYLYSGFIYCHCGSKMSGRTDHGVRRYACIQSATYRAHPDASLAEHVVDTAIFDWLQELREKLNDAARIAPRRPQLVADPARDIERRLARLTERFDSATLKFVDDQIPADTYERLRASFEAERTALEAERSRASAQATVRPLAFVGDLLDYWPDLPIERRREALRLLADRVVVNTPDASPRVRVLSPLT